jgi:dTDP-4-dehydrorhamnose reductase
MVASIKEMKWAITGGSGQLGKSIAEKLVNFQIPHVSWSHSELDISQESSIAMIDAESPDVLINCAAWTHVDGAESNEEAANKANRDGVRNMAIAAKSLGIPLVHISTDYVFSGSGSRPWKIDDETNPTSKYGLSKLLGEHELLSIYPSKSYILRTAWLYGPYGKNFAKTILKKAITEREVIKVVNDQIGQPTSTIDLADQILRLAEAKPTPGIYHATNSGKVSWWEFAKELLSLAGESESRVIPITSKEFITPVKRPSYSVLDHSEWNNVGMDPMRDWRESLGEVFPRLISNVKEEIARG